MRVHNLMEDMVLAQVNQIFDEAETQEDRKICTCYQCRLDVSCYVLNRIPPAYTVSGRGMAHHETETRSDIQKNVDLVALINEGIGKVSRTMRPHLPHDNGRPLPHPDGPLFNFPLILGRILDGSTFEPLSEGTVTLQNANCEPVQMMDPNWPNPYTIVTNTAGHFNFWPFPAKADEMGTGKVFSFRLTACSEKYEELQHFFELALVAQAEFSDSCSLEYNHKLPDLHIFPRGRSRKQA
jgi:competence protein ComFB